MPSRRRCSRASGAGRRPTSRGRRTRRRTAWRTRRSTGSRPAARCAWPAHGGSRPRSRGAVHTVVCYGDSNTHGADPITHGRFPRDVRWPGVLASELGDAAAVIEEGLNGRTTLWDDPFMDFRNGKPYLLPCLRSHQPVDVLVLMLGTNDLKTIFGRAAHEIAAGAGALVDIALTSGTGPGGGPPAVLLVAPPRLGDTTDRSEIWGFG